MVSMSAVAAAQDRIAKEAVSIAGQIESALIDESNLLGFESQPQGAIDGTPLRFVDDMRPTGSRISNTAIGRPLRRRPNFCSATAAGKDSPLPDERVEDRIVTLVIVRLKNAAIPLQTKPFQVALQGIDVARLGSFAVEVLKSEKNLRARRSRVEPTQQPGDQCPRMNATGRRRCESSRAPMRGTSSV